MADRRRRRGRRSMDNTKCKKTRKFIKVYEV
jgi:hypothetical protein